MAKIVKKGNPLDLEHPEFERSVYTWQMIRRFIEGPSSIKRENVLYLPMPAAMITTPVSPIANITTDVKIDSKVPWYFPQNKAYEAYLRRAKVPDIASFALRGLLGIATRKSPAFQLPSEISYMEENATNTGLSLIGLFHLLCSRVLSVGRVGLLLDQVENTGQFHFVVYETEALHNWNSDIIKGKRMLLYVVAREAINKGDEIYSHDTKDEFIVLHLNSETGFYTVTRYNDEGVEIGVVEPVILGKSLSKIPFSFIGSIDNTAEVDESPMQGIVEEALTIYHKDADLSNAEYMTCNPMLVATGVGDSELPSAVGSNIALLISNSEAKVYYPDTDTSGLDHVAKRIDKAHEQAAIYCANLLSPDRKGIESSETVRLRQSASGASLHSVVMSVASAIEDLLGVAQEWAGKSTSEISFIANTEFADVSLSPQEMQSLIQAYLQQTMSLETLVENWRRAGLLQEGETMEDELERLEKSNTNLLEDEENDPNVDDD